MHTMHTRARSIAPWMGIWGLSLVAVPRIAAGQEGRCENLLPRFIQGPADAREPKVLIPTFHADSGALAIEVSVQLRSYLTQHVEKHTLYVLPCQAVDTLLKSAGFTPDSATSRQQLSDIARALGASESVDGLVTRQPDGQLRVDARVYYGNRVNVSEPLPTVVGRDPGAIARLLVPEYLEARKQFPGYQQCVYANGDRKYAEAAAGARQGLAAYPKALMSRYCLMTAYGNMPGVSPDSVIAVAREIMATDTASNAPLLATLGDAFNTKLTNDTGAAKAADRDSTVLYYWKFYEAGHRPDVAKRVVAILAPNAQERALTKIDTLLASVPNDTTLNDTKFLILMHLNRHRDAEAAFNTLIKIDPSKASLDYYDRVIGAAQGDSDVPTERRYLQDATARYPKEATLWMEYSSVLDRAGRLQDARDAAQRAVGANPAFPNGYAIVIQYYIKLNQPDSGIAYARAAVAAGTNKDSLAPGLFTLLGPVMKRAQATDTSRHAEDIANWQAALRVAETLDSVIANTQSKFFVGVTALYLAQRMLNTVNETMKSDKGRACSSDLALVDGLVSESNDAIVTGGGGRYDRETAANIMNGVGLLRGAVAQYRSAVPCRLGSWSSG